MRGREGEGERGGEGEGEKGRKICSNNGRNLLLICCIWVIIVKTALQTTIDKIYLKMLDINLICEFSRQNCVAICAFLVPINLIFTLNTIVLVFLMRPFSQIRLAAAFANLFALTLFLHILTWWTIGIFTSVSVILIGLGTTCLIINFIAIIYPSLGKIPAISRFTLRFRGS